MFTSGRLIIHNYFSQISRFAPVCCVSIKFLPNTRIVEGWNRTQSHQSSIDHLLHLLFIGVAAALSLPRWAASSYRPPTARAPRRRQPRRHLDGDDHHLGLIFVIFLPLIQKKKIWRVSNELGTLHNFCVSFSEFRVWNKIFFVFFIVQKFQRWKV